jgi:hypothetical protein
MTPDELDALIQKAEKGEMNPYEQNCIAFELITYRAMAIRLEKSLHHLIKEIEDFDDQINYRFKAEQELKAIKERYGL